MHDSHSHRKEDLVESLQADTSSEGKGTFSGHEISESKHVGYFSGHAHGHAKVDKEVATKDVPSCSGYSHAHEHRPVHDDTIVSC